MRKRALSLVCVIIVVLYASSCITLPEARKQKYESLTTAVIYSKFLVKGKFGHNIPPEFNAEKFLEVVKGKIPPDSYEVLQKYSLIVIPKEGYYLIEVFDPKDNSLILFSYSCETGAEGRVLEEPGKYDINHLELYDKCKTRH
jgi:hypothetical protein